MQTLGIKHIVNAQDIFSVSRTLSRLGTIKLRVTRKTRERVFLWWRVNEYTTALLHSGSSLPDHVPMTPTACPWKFLSR